MAAPIIDDLADLLTTEVSFRIPSAKNERGTVTAWNATQTAYCRVVGRTRRVMTPQGTETTSSYHIVLDGYYGITHDTEFTLPSRLVPSVVRPIAIQKSEDENGPHHERVYFP
mgnify:FL=1